MNRLITAALLCGLGATGIMASESVGAVFAATNDPNQNEIVMYSRSDTGALKYIGSFATGGRGEGGKTQSDRVGARDPRSACQERDRGKHVPHLVQK